MKSEEEYNYDKIKIVSFTHFYFLCFVISRNEKLGKCPSYPKLTVKAGYSIMVQKG